MKKEVALFILLVIFSFSIFYYRDKIYFALGDYYFGGGKYDLKKAEMFYRKTLSIDENFPRVHYQLGRINFLNSKFSEAKLEIIKEIELYPDFYKSYYMKGLIEGYALNFDEAIKSFEKFQEYDSFNWAAYNDISWVYFQKGDYENAKKVALDGLEKAHNNPWLNNSLGITLLNLKDFSGAKEAFRKALTDIDSIGPEVWGKSYPGNDPKVYKEGYIATRDSIIFNLKIAEENLSKINN